MDSTHVTIDCGEYIITLGAPTAEGEWILSMKTSTHEVSTKIDHDADLYSILIDLRVLVCHLPKGLDLLRVLNQHRYEINEKFASLWIEYRKSLPPPNENSTQ